MRYLLLLLTLLLLTSTARAQSDEETVSAMLDDFHQAASEADGARYFGHFAENAIFLGTDVTERWTLEQFKAYALPYFDKGQGWTYTPQARHVYFAGETAWFDETLHNEGFGACRGSGVLVKVDGQWKVAQYHLTVPIPNALLRRVVEMIREAEQ